MRSSLIRPHLARLTRGRFEVGLAGLSMLLLAGKNPQSTLAYSVVKVP